MTKMQNVVGPVRPTMSASIILIGMGSDILGCSLLFAGSWFLR